MAHISGYSLRNLQPDWKHGQPLKLAQGASGCDRLPHAGLSSSRHLLTPFLAHRRCAVESPSTPVARLVPFFAQGVTPTPNVAQHLDTYPSLFKQSFVSKTSASPPKFPGQQFAYSFLENSFPPSLTPFRPPATMIGFLMIVAALPTSRFHAPVFYPKRRVSLLGDSRKPAPIVAVFFWIRVCPMERDSRFCARIP